MANAEEKNEISNIGEVGNVWGLYKQIGAASFGCRPEDVQERAGSGGGHGVIGALNVKPKSTSHMQNKSI